MTLTDRQVAAAVYGGGFRGSELPTAVAVALAESGGDPHITHRNSNGSVDYGLMQINSIHSQILAAGRWDDPTSNAKMGYQIYVDAGKKFTPWNAYKNLRYRLFMARAVVATRNLGGNVPAPADPNAPGLGKVTLPDVSGVLQTIAFLSDARNWRRVGIFLAGLLLGAFGLWGIVKDTRAGEAAMSAAKKAASTARTAVEVAAVA
jgi:Lysozyme like domain